MVSLFKIKPICILLLWNTKHCLKLFASHCWLNYCNPYRNCCKLPYRKGLQNRRLRQNNQADNILYLNYRMKAISLLQPWASLVVMGLKTIETRSWATQHRGTILIHASQGKAGSIFAQESWLAGKLPTFNCLPFGAIIGSVTITAVTDVSHTGLPEDLLARLTMEEKAFGDYTTGRFAWLLADAVQFVKPIPARGMLHIWDYKEIIAETDHL